MARVLEPMDALTEKGSRLRDDMEISAYRNLMFLDRRVSGITLQVSGDKTISSPSLLSPIRQAAKIAHKAVRAWLKAMARLTPTF